MDAPLLTSQASAALTALTTQLSHLESQQRALLSSISVTHSALQTLPAYTQVAPTLAAIPHYTKKLERLKRQMAMQTADVEALKRRAMEAGRKRRENAQRVRDRRREEGERDRTVLRARVAVLETTAAAASGRSTPSNNVAGGSGEVSSVVVVDDAGAEGSNMKLSEEPAPTPAVRVVKRRKKARKVEME